MDKVKKIKIIILSVLIALTLAFIWGNSCLSTSASSSESKEVYGAFNSILDFLFGQGVITHSIFRKLMHFGEFSLLGLEINLLFISLFGIKVEKILHACSLGLLIAVIDESIQILSNRGPAVIDVLIDLAGYIVATLILFIVIAVVKIIKNRKQKV